jgi:glucose/arabinose dehydrogenase
MTTSMALGRAAATATLITLFVAVTGCAGPDVTPAPTTRSTDAPSPPASPTAPPPATAIASPSIAPDTGTVTLVGEPRDVVTGLSAPWSIAFIGETALISERETGVIWELVDDGSLREVARIQDLAPTGEGGLLGLAIGADERLYAYSSGPNGNRVQRFELTGAAGSYGLGAADTILDGLPYAGFHNGGRIAFGPDGMLYVCVGDATEGASAQALDVLAGKILRMTPDGEVPADNPFPGSLVFSLGHRNVQGIDWAADGTMFASEFGQDTWDELNVIVPGGNYGWPTIEGTAGETGFIDPVQQWTPGEASPSGLTVIDGTVFIANLRGQVLRAVPVADPSAATDLYVGEYGRLRDVTLAPDGSLWILTSNTDGRGDPADGDDRILSVDVSR